MEKQRDQSDLRSRIIRGFEATHSRLEYSSHNSLKTRYRDRGFDFCPQSVVGFEISDFHLQCILRILGVAVAHDQ